MAPLPSDQLSPLTRRFQQQLAAIGERSTPILRNIWSKLAGYNEADIRTFARNATPIMRGAKTAAVRHAVGYYALTAGVRPVPVRIDAVPADWDPREPFISVWSSFKNGGTFDDSVAAGANRTSALVENLISSSSRQTGDLVAESAQLRIVGWERVADGNACEWCQELNGTIFDTSEAADFGHDRCGCTAQPIYAS